jgi:hypothetical protein
MSVQFIANDHRSHLKFTQFHRFFHPARDARIIDSVKYGKIKKQPSSGKVFMNVLMLHVNSIYQPRQVATAFRFSNEEIEPKKFQDLARPKLSFLGRENLIPSIEFIPQEVFVNVFADWRDKPSLEAPLRSAFNSFCIFLPENIIGEIHYCFRQRETPAAVDQDEISTSEASA